MMETSHMLPFLWLSGQGEEELRRAVQEIAASGCKALCAESRVHPDFLGESWWRDLDVITDECKRLGMCYYLLDDTHFPSGYANGAAKGTPYCRMMMTESHMDVRGPRQGGCILAQEDGDNAQLVAVIAARRVESFLREEFVDIGGWKVDSLTDLTDRVEDGLVRWDVPEGDWRVFVLKAKYVSERNPPQFFVNPLLSQGGQLMIDTVYEPHFRRYGQEFGKTFLGFFSDEPALRAGRGCKAALGEYPQLPIPWRMDLPEILTRQMGRPARLLLPGLWYDIGEDTPRIRYALMDTVSRLYGENYSESIGKWCRAHGVHYIGHVIEQNGAHSRLGQGAGHFFRAMSGQDMSGMDFVLHEMKMEFRDTTHAWKSQDFEAQDDFFRYMLPQLTASCAWLDEKKQGRALCEIFGAYGWQENMEEMRYMANLLLSRGINRFVPHAFSLKPFPDPDSPPHFGHYNPMMPHIERLFRRMERSAALLDSGRVPCRVGVLYHAEAEWACGKRTMQTQAVVKVLHQHQIPCEIVPVDMLQAGRYDALYIPHGRLWPRKLFDRLAELSAVGCRIVFVDAMPEGLSEGQGDVAELTQAYFVLPLAQVAGDAAQHTRRVVEPLDDYPAVTCLPYEKDGQLLLALFNDDCRESVTFRFRAPGLKHPVCCDLEGGSCVQLPDHGEQTVTLTPGQLLFVGPWREGWPVPEEPRTYGAIGKASPTWQIQFLDDDLPGRKADAPIDLTTVAPRYMGRAVLTCQVEAPNGCTMLELNCRGAAVLSLDGHVLATPVCAPYCVPVTPGCHTLAVELTVPVFFHHHDPLSFFNYVEPVGIFGEVTFLKENEDAK